MFFWSLYTKTAIFVYERVQNKGPYTKTAIFVYGP